MTYTKDKEDITLKLNEVEFYKELLRRIPDLRYVAYELIQRPKTRILQFV